MIETIDSSDYGQFKSKRTEFLHYQGQLSDLLALHPSPKFSALLFLSTLACNIFEMLVSYSCIGILSQF